MIGSGQPGAFSKYDVARIIKKWQIPGEITTTTNWYRAATTFVSTAFHIITGLSITHDTS
jgi:hypothetical protein